MDVDEDDGVDFFFNDGDSHTDGPFDPASLANEGKAAGLTDNQVLERLGDVEESSSLSKKRRLPQPKLNEERLCSPTAGIPLLPKLFADYTYDSKKNEFENLDKVMNALEHWAHVLFPKLALDDFLARTEQLGTKRAVKTCLTKIRLDMPLLDEDFVPEQNRDEEEDEPQMSVPVAVAEAEAESHSPPPSAPTPVTLTEEQKQRIEANRLRALEIKERRRREQLGLDASEDSTEPVRVSATDGDGVSSSENLPRESQESFLTEDELLTSLRDPSF